MDRRLVIASAAAALLLLILVAAWRGSFRAAQVPPDGGAAAQRELSEPPAPDGAGEPAPAERQTAPREQLAAAPAVPATAGERAAPVTATAQHEAGCTVRGHTRIEAADGGGDTPASGTLVWIAGEARWLTRADAGGAYTLAAVAPGQHQLTAKHPHGPERLEHPISIDTACAVAGETDFDFAPGTGKITGTVADDRGVPIACDQVELMEWRDAKRRLVLSEFDFDPDAPAGQRAPYYRAIQLSLGAGRHAAVCDSRGVFAVEGLTAGTYRVSVTAAGYAEGEVEDVEPDAGPLHITLAEGAGVDGRIDPADPGAECMAHARDGAGEPHFARVRDSAFRLDDVAPGLLDLRVKCSADSVTRIGVVRGVEVQPRTRTTVRVPLEATGAIELHVVDETSGAPLSTRVSAHALADEASAAARGKTGPTRFFYMDNSAFEETGADGRARLDGLTAGDYRVEAGSWNDGTVPHEQTVTVRAGETAGPIELRLKSGLDDPERLGGIVGLGFDRRDGAVRVTGVSADAPAGRAGIQPGDVIVAIDGRRADRMQYDEIISSIRGAIGAWLLLEIERNGQPLSFVLTREAAKQPAE